MRVSQAPKRATERRLQNCVTRPERLPQRHVRPSSDMLVRTMAIALSELSGRDAPIPLTRRIYGQRASTIGRAAVLVIAAAALYFGFRIAPAFLAHVDADRPVANLAADAAPA